MPPLGNGKAYKWVAEQECLKRVKTLMGRRWDAQQKSLSEPEYYWRVRDADAHDLLARAKSEAAQMGLAVGPGDGSGDVGIFLESDSAGGTRLVFAY